MFKGSRNVKVSELEHFVSSKAKPISSIGVDERGSLQMSIKRNRRSQQRKGSVASASFTSYGLSDFSFHPDINRSTMWRPKYQDHHDHERMFDRMHRENQKIISKKRLMSAEKDRAEMIECTFTPQLVTSKNKQPKNPKNTQIRSARLYQYAEKFERNKALKKIQFDQERSACFIPKINHNDFLSFSRKKGEVHEDLYVDYTIREKNIISAKENLNV
jgi:hypothetical protein